MHELRRTNDSVDRAGVAAQQATDAGRFVDNGNSINGCFRKWYFIPAEQTGKPPNRVFAAWRAQVYGGRAIDHCGRVGEAAGVTALGALCLRQQFIHLLYQVTL